MNVERKFHIENIKMHIKHMVISDEVREKILFKYIVSGDENPKGYSSMDKSDIFEKWRKEYGEEELHTCIQEMKESEEIRVNYDITDDYDSINNIEVQLDTRGVVNREVLDSIFTTITDKVSRLEESHRCGELDFLIMVHVKRFENNDYTLDKHFVYMIIYKVKIRNVGIIRNVMTTKGITMRLIEYKFVVKRDDVED